jgi:DNA-binding response OmpR family regulator
MLSIAGKPKRIPLTEKETLILKMLVRSFPTPVAKEVLLQEVWGFQSDLATHTLETHIYRLRQKIKTLTEITFIFTTENGYGLVGGGF